VKDKITAAFHLLRVPQWVKNTFIFLPLFFGGKLFEVDLFLNSLVTFFGFSLIASAVYIFNDWFDIEFDRLHPTKKFRPLASGKLNKKEAACLLLFVLTLGFAIILTRIENPVVYLIIVIYLFQNIAYTLKLKHFAIIDVTIIALGFVVRILLGGAVTEIILSQWIIIITFLLALFLAFTKRREDVLFRLNTNEKLRKNIDGYNLEFLNASMVITGTIVIVSYIMYTTSFETVSRVNHYLYTTAFFVVLAIFRFMQFAFVRGQNSEPLKILTQDLFLQLLLAGWSITFFVMLYANKLG
jgi:decaprenyl-phosphate phosphoribosyltransferase